jgi:hypothetical protein
MSNQTETYELERFGLVGGDWSRPADVKFYPVGWYDRYVELFEWFEAATTAEREALQGARDRLRLAKIDYDEARAASPEVIEADEARAALAEFRRFIHPRGFSFPHPDKLIRLHEED